jgi:iron complex outermembrane receptor protein
MAGTALAAIAVGGFAQAQEAAPPAPGEAAVDEVVVTGSRIRGVAPVGSAVIALGREDLDASGAVTTAQFLQQAPQIFNLGVSETSRGQAGGAGNITYGTSINIRGISPYATLTLLNGHRAVQQGTSGFALDPSIIPTLSLERAEIVADGASAIYGSDAVAGVVNLILRRNFQGVETVARYGVADGYDERQIGLIAGHRWATGQFTISFENAWHSALNGSRRDFYQSDLRPRGGGDFRTTQCAPGNIVVNNVSYAIPAGGVTAATRGALAAATTNRCDNLKLGDLIPRQNHNSGAFTFDQTINDWLSLSADGFAARRDFKFRPQPLIANLTVPSTNAFFVAPPGLTPASETVQYSFLRDLPPNVSRGFSKAYEMTLGAEVKLPYDWRLGLHYTYGRSDDLSVSRQGINNAALATALASSDPATAFNPFGSAPNNPTVLAAIGNALFYAPGKNIFQDYEIEVSGALFSLPAGEVRLAAGAEGQRLTTFGGLTNGSTIAPTSTRVGSGRTIRSVYGELLVPLFGDANAVPGIRKLELNLAGRYDHYSDVGSTTNPKVGVNWEPIEGLTLRGSYGTSFRAPLFSQLKGNSQGLFAQNYSDPLLGGALRNGVALSGGNLNLVPETATTWSIGADYNPPFSPNTRLSIGYFDIDYRNQITAYLSDLTILNREAQFAGTGIITRNPTPEFVAQLRAQYPVLGGVVPNPLTLFVDGRTNNLGTTIARGLDFQLNHRIAAEHAGDFRLGLSGTYFTDYRVAITPTAPLIDQLNNIFNPLKFKARGVVGWTRGGARAEIAVNYQNAYNNNLANPVQRVRAFKSVDFHLSQTFEDQLGRWGRGVTLGIDVTNLFDAHAPFVNIAASQNGGGGFDPTLYNPVGRLVSFEISRKW